YRIGRLLPDLYFPKNRKKDRNAFLKHLADSLKRRMDEEFDV
ncbi:hypothetical protein EZS27_034505, partial [termite gut metagenome]